MNKVKNIKFNYKVFLFCFCFLFIYEYLIVNKGQPLYADDLCYPFLAVDYSMGFCTQFLPGAIYHFLVGIYTPFAARIYINILYIVFFIVIAFVLEFVYSKAVTANKKDIGILLLLCIVGGFSISTFVMQPGMLDFYWLFFFCLAVLSLKNRYTKFLIPVFSVLMVLVHIAASITYVFLLLVILGFLWFYTSERKAKKEYAIVFCLTLFLTVATVLYFIIFEKNNLVYSFNDFQKILESRGVNYITYYQVTLYGQNLHAEGLILEYPAFFNALPPVIGKLLQQLWMTMAFYEWKSEFTFLLPLAVIFLVLFAVMMRNYFKTLQKKLSKLLIVATALWAIPIMLCGVLFSTDMARWMSHAVLYMCGVCLCISVCSKQCLFSRARESVKPYYPVVLLIIAVYSLILFEPIA